MPLCVLEGLQTDGFGLAARRIRPGDEERRVRYVRMCTSWCTSQADVDFLLGRVRAHVGAEKEAATAATVDTATLARL